MKAPGLERLAACWSQRQGDPLAPPLVMGVVNVTPDSFSDAGAHYAHEHAIAHALRLAEEGADLIDVGGESTRPGALSVSLELEWARVAPVLEALRDAHLPVSIDTRKPELMSRAMALGVAMINDVGGFREAAARHAVANWKGWVCCMHMLGDPHSMQQAPQYDDVRREVWGWLQQQARLLMDIGITPDRIVLDPGFGFGKTLEHNLSLLAGLRQDRPDFFPVLVGLSRKSMLGAITGRPVQERLAASVAAALLAAQQGVAFIRVHDVAATCDALKIWSAMRRAK